MSDLRDRFRLVANVVENVEAPDLPNLPVGRAVWAPQPDFATSAACWLAAGAAHHTVMTTAVGIDVFRDFAEIAKTELVVIDDTTTVRDFQRELRWNQAYYRLAQGI
jgi:L-arabinose isomerase